MVLAFVVGLVMLGYATQAHAAPGDLDFSFRSGGKVTTDFAASGEEGLAVAVQDDDRVVVAGYAYTGTPAGYDLALYNTNGAPYATFSGDGKVITPLGSSYEEAYGVAVQGTKIVAVGASYQDGPSSGGSAHDFAVVRYSQNGDLYSTFSGDGKHTTCGCLFSHFAPEAI